jgi:hypothetical protein
MVIPAEIRPRLHPLRFDHINFNGRYPIAPPRPQRRPATPARPDRRRGGLDRGFWRTFREVGAVPRCGCTAEHANLGASVGAHLVPRLSGCPRSSPGRHADQPFTQSATEPDRDRAWPRPRFDALTCR